MNRTSKTLPRAALVFLFSALVWVWVASPLMAAGHGKTKLTWYGQSAFKIVTPSGGVILIDPWLTVPTNPGKATAIAELGRVDYILITHAHRDHVGNAVQIAKKTGAHLVTSAGLRRNLVAIYKYPPKQGTGRTSGNVGGSIPLPKAGVTVTIVNAIHGSELTFPKGYPGAHGAAVGGNPVGMVIEIKGGPTFYHTGDTDVFMDMKLIDEFFDVDIMLSTIGDHYTMGPKRAALAVEFVKPKIVIPMHFATFGLLRGRPGPFQQAMKARGLSTKMVEMKPGETRSF